jgi:hypothetical protein
MTDTAFLSYEGLERAANAARELGLALFDNETGGAADNANSTAAASAAAAAGTGSRPLVESFRLAATLCAALILAHTVTVSYIAWRDLTGQWGRFALIENRHPTLSMYWKGYKKFVFDIVVMLLPALCVVSHFRWEAVALATERDPTWPVRNVQHISSLCVHRIPPEDHYCRSSIVYNS